LGDAIGWVAAASPAADMAMTGWRLALHASTSLTRTEIGRLLCRRDGKRDSRHRTNGRTRAGPNAAR